MSLSRNSDGGIGVAAFLAAASFDAARLEDKKGEKLCSEGATKGSEPDLRRGALTSSAAVEFLTTEAVAHRRREPGSDARTPGGVKG